MAEVNFSEQVKMWPWIGKNYFSTSPKVLILGESLYGGYATKNHIRNQVQGIVDESWTWAYFTKLKNVFNLESEKYDGSINKESFWESVCYYEYLTHAMHEPKEPVPEEFWSEAKKPFVEVVKKLKPDVIICIGYDTFEHLPDFGEEHKTISKRGVDDKLLIWRYDRLNSKQLEKPVYICKIKHPSSYGVKNEDWFNLFRKFLNTL